MLSKIWIKRLRKGETEVTRGVCVGLSNSQKNAREWKGEGGMLMEIRKKLIEQSTEMEIQEKGIVMRYVRQDRKKWRVVGVHVSKDIEKKLQEVEQRIENKRQRFKTILGEDFNARTAKESKIVEKEKMEKKGRGRRSKDRKIDKKGKILLDFIEKKGGGFSMGRYRGMEESIRSQKGGGIR